jgi:hypothetical protein
MTKKADKGTIAPKSIKVSLRFFTGMIVLMIYAIIMFINKNLDIDMQVHMQVGHITLQPGWRGGVNTIPTNYKLQQITNRLLHLIKKYVG